MVFNKYEGWVAVDDRDAEEGVKTKFKTSGLQFGIPICWVFCAESQMPLADTCGCISRSLGDIRNRRLIRIDHQGTTQKNRAPQGAMAHRVTAGDQGITRGRTNSRSGVCVRETPALCGEAIKVRRIDMSCPVTTDIAVPDIISKNDHDIGLGCGAGLKCRCRETG